MDTSSDVQHKDVDRQSNVVDDCPAASTTDDQNSTVKNYSGANNAMKKLFFDLCSDCYFPRRYVVVLLLFVGMCVVHAQRVNVGVAVVSIIDYRHRMLVIELNKTSDTSDISVIAFVKDTAVRLSTCCLYTYRPIYELIYTQLTISHIEVLSVYTKEL